MGDVQFHREDAARAKSKRHRISQSPPAQEKRDSAARVCNPPTRRDSGRRLLLHWWLATQRDALSMPEGESAPGAISKMGDETMMPSGLRFCRVFGQPQGPRGELQRNVLVPRFFLTFSSLDVPYISRGSGRHFSLVQDWPRLTV